MKKLISFLFLLSLTLHASNDEATAQVPYFFEASTTACTTDSCDVLLRQHTGLYVGWTLRINCFDSAGNWSGWNEWSGDGVYSGTICGG